MTSTASVHGIDDIHSASTASTAQLRHTNTRFYAAATHHDPLHTSCRLPAAGGRGVPCPRMHHTVVAHRGQVTDHKLRVASPTGVSGHRVGVAPQGSAHVRLHIELGSGRTLSTCPHVQLGSGRTLSTCLHVQLGSGRTLSDEAVTEWGDTCTLLWMLPNHYAAS